VGNGLWDPKFGTKDYGKPWIYMMHWYRGLVLPVESGLTQLWMKTDLGNVFGVVADIFGQAQGIFWGEMNQEGNFVKGISLKPKLFDEITSLNLFWPDEDAVEFGGTCTCPNNEV
jgi:hypothetical protein